MENRRKSGTWENNIPENIRSLIANIDVNELKKAEQIEKILLELDDEKKQKLCDIIKTIT